MPELFGLDGMKTDSLEHHGILGMHWGQRRYQNLDGSLTAAGRLRYGSVSSNSSDATKPKMIKTKEGSFKEAVEKFNSNFKLSKTDRKKAKAEAEAAKKKEIEERKAQAKAEADAKKREEILKSGNAYKMLANLDLFTVEEINAVANRQQAVNRLKTSMSDPVGDVIKNANKAVNAGETVIKGFSTYTKGANMINRIAKKEVLPEFSAEKEKAKKAEERQKKVDTMPLNEFMSHLNDFTSDEIKRRMDRERNSDLLRNRLNSGGGNP